MTVPAASTPADPESLTYGLLSGNEPLAALAVPGSTAASAVFIGASPMNLSDSKRRARARVLHETTETLPRVV